MTTHQEVYETAIATLAQQFRTAIAMQADLISISQEALTKAVFADLLGEERFADGRAHQWRVRTRLYDRARPDDPEADSDPELSPEQPGTTIVRGLPAVMKLLVDQASQHHGAACAGLDMKTLMRKVPSLRTQLSYRGDGSGTLRADYEANCRFGVRYMLARCDVYRVDRTGHEPTRRPPSMRRDPPNISEAMLAEAHRPTR